MKVASALVAGRQPDPALAEAAVRQALSQAGLSQAGSVILFLTPDFARQAQAAVKAVARAAGCLQVFGATAAGIFNETDVLLDQSGAAVLVLDHLEHADSAVTPQLSLACGTTLPQPWRQGEARAGLLQSDGKVWAHGRLSEEPMASLPLAGLQAQCIISNGLQLLGQPATVDSVRGHDLLILDGEPALENLRRRLPAGLRSKPPLHHLVLVKNQADPAIALLCANADGSLTLAEPPQAGEQVLWAIRQPLGAETDMRQTLAAAVDINTQPDFALMFSCIGRGPLFYGQDDLDVAAFRTLFPHTPMLGAYGSGQIVPGPQGNRLFQNTVLTLLCGTVHV
jgi:small ligand-binding sensory domain FIST